MNSKIFVHFMNRIDDLSERINMIQVEVEKLREELKETRKEGESEDD